MVSLYLIKDIIIHMKMENGGMNKVSANSYHNPLDYDIARAYVSSVIKSYRLKSSRTNSCSISHHDLSTRQSPISGRCGFDPGGTKCAVGREERVNDIVSRHTECPGSPSIVCATVRGNAFRKMRGLLARKRRVTVKTHKPIVFDLMTNAADSLRQAVELLALKESGTDHARLKHAITNSAHCVELLLKERLRLINPAFVWENVDRYPNLDARTVTVDTAISRLKAIGGVTISLDDERTLRSLRTTRNAIEHYEWHTSEKEARVIVGHALSFAFGFASDELAIDLAESFKQDDIWNMLRDELYEFARIHGARLEASLRAKGDFPQCCDECGELTVPMRGGSCELCGHWQSIDDDA